MHQETRPQNFLDSRSSPDGFRVEILKAIVSQHHDHRNLRRGLPNSRLHGALIATMLWHCHTCILCTVVCADQKSLKVLSFATKPEAVM